jgi:hypothetical protein
MKTLVRDVSSENDKCLDRSVSVTANGHRRSVHADLRSKPYAHQIWTDGDRRNRPVTR